MKEHKRLNYDKNIVVAGVTPCYIRVIARRVITLSSSMGEISFKKSSDIYIYILHRRAAYSICESSFLIHHGIYHDLFVCP